MKKLRLFMFLAVLAVVYSYGASTFGIKAAAATETKPLEGKTISILGDSISTFINYSNGSAAQSSNSTIANNAVYYGGAAFGVNETWWKQAADISGATILVNNSYSGCRFSSEREVNGEIIPPAYMDRCVQLHDDTGANAGQEPDIIAIYLGTNDFNALVGTNDNFDASTLDYASLITGGVYKKPQSAAEAYAIMIDKITQRYKSTEVYCFTILENETMNSTKVERLKKFNKCISSIASHYGAYVVDLYEDSGITTKTDSSGASAYLANTLHPHIYGMDAITGCFLSSIYKNSKYIPDTTAVYNIEYDIENNIKKELFKQGTPTAVLGTSFTLDFFKEAKDACKSLKITMGGVDITSSCLKNDKIYISAVTGDIVIQGEEHVCNFVATKVVKETCTSRGWSILKCTQCGKSDTVFNESVSKGHQYDGDSDADCNTCGKIRQIETTETIDALNTTEPVNDTDQSVSAERGGCGSNVSLSILTSAVAVAGLVFRKKKRQI